MGKTKRVFSRFYVTFIIIICILLMVLLLDLSIGAYRGYGLFKTAYYSKNPLFFAIEDVFELSEYMTSYFRSSPEKMPSPKMVDMGVDCIFLTEEQPYSNYDIWVFESKRKKGYKYLYSPLSLLVKDNKPDSVPDDIKFWDVVAFCSWGIYDAQEKKYKPYLLPDFYEKKLTPLKWPCYTFTGIPSHIETTKPPIPGSYIFHESDLKNKHLCYTENILGILKSIYPKYVP